MVDIVFQKSLTVKTPVIQTTHIQEEKAKIISATCQGHNDLSGQEEQFGCDLNNFENFGWE